LVLQQTYHGASLHVAQLEQQQHCVVHCPHTMPLLCFICCLLPHPQLEDMALDPTLDQCCRRDIQSQIAKERIRQCLQREDRIDARQRVSAAAVCRDPAALAAASLQEQHLQVQQQLENDELNSDEFLEDGEAADAADAELAMLRQQRLAQLRAQSAAQQEVQRSGFGNLNDVQEGKLMALLREPPGRGLLVVHLAVQGHEPCNTLDECLAAAAAQYRCGQ
jgi:hypothetical protein